MALGTVGSVTRGATKLVLGIDGGLQRFDLANDPEEEAPLATETAELEALLSEAGVAFRPFEASSESSSELSSEVVEQLKALGYIQERHSEGVTELETDGPGVRHPSSAERSQRIGPI